MRNRDFPPPAIKLLDGTLKKENDNHNDDEGGLQQTQYNYEEVNDDEVKMKTIR